MIRSDKAIRLSLPTLRQLAYLVALDEQQHFGRAAAQVFVSQSALSVGIAELERQLGVTLVDRSKRRIRLTPIGKDTVARARSVLRGAEDLLTAAQASGEPLVGALRMAAIPTIAPYLLPHILSELERSHPRLDLFVREMLTAPACAALQQGAVDCVLLALPVECGEVEICEIGVDRLLLAVGAEDEAATGPTHAGEVEADRLLLLEDGHCLTDHALAACDLSARAREPRLVASTLQTLVGLVDAGWGVTLLPQLAVSAGVLRGTGVSVQPVEGVDAVRRLSLVWRTNNPRRSDFELLGRALRRVVRAVVEDR